MQNIQRAQNVINNKDKVNYYNKPSSSKDKKYQVYNSNQNRYKNLYNDNVTPSYKNPYEEPKSKPSQNRPISGSNKPPSRPISAKNQQPVVSKVNHHHDPLYQNIKKQFNPPVQ